MARSALRFVTFLAPNMYPVYDCVVRYVGTRLGRPTELVVGTSYDDLIHDGHAGFICGLAYIKLRRQHPEALEPLVAPQLAGARYQGRPVYFSDVIVHRESPWRTLGDLRGRTWAYNEPDSHSGYGVVEHTLRQLGHSWSFFGEAVQTGWHERSIRLVRDGFVDASAIDSQVLAVALRDAPELATKLRVIGSLGPSTVQPLVAGRRLSRRVRREIQEVLTEMHAEPAVRRALAHGFVERFVRVNDRSYDDIRAMCHTTDSAVVRHPPHASAKRKRKIRSA
ncbi:MAG TPA: PhnD/SsuA/transferrin family substrate-binding protein [Gemmataceae bacterium]|nr:PhnD/SsuA/transferrin family substrate-binding protein [Gemmataceae bacterium]